MDYVYEMARTLRFERELPLTLVIEKGDCAQEDAAWCRAQSYRNAPLRILENLFILLRLRLSGHKIFYIHYSFVSAISAGLITKLFGGTVYYWNAGMPWFYKRSFLTERYQKLAYRLIDVLVTGAEALRTGYVDFYKLKPEQIKVIPNWINLHETKNDAAVRTEIRTKYGLSEEAKVLLYVHKLAKRKGAHFLPEILDKLRDNSSIYLAVVGDGPLEAELNREIAERQLTDRIIMTGRLDREEVTQWYQAADLFVMPSEEEGSPHALIEAMAYGLPFVTFAVGGVAETAPPAWHYCYSYGAVDELVAGTRELLSNQQKYQEAQTQVTKWVTIFDKPVIVDEFVKLFT